MGFTTFGRGIEITIRLKGGISLVEVLITIIVALILLSILLPGGIMIYLYFVNRNQKDHAVLRNYPILGKMRYLLEKIGPELRQYLYHNDREGKPFSRTEYQDIVLPAKYKSRIVGFGSKRDFTQGGYYIKNTMFPKQRDELKIDNSKQIATKIYKIDDEHLFNRKEHFENHQADPYYLHDDDQIVIGENCTHPFYLKGLVGMSGMSYGALGERAITALSKGIGLAGGSWMNTGEGGLSDYHLKGGTDIIMQIGPGLFGVRNQDGSFSWEELKHKSEIEEVKAFELKLAQGAKTRGGHVDGSKVTPEIAKIRNLEPYKSIDSPNRFNEFDDLPGFFEFIEKIRNITGKPVGIKIVVGHEEQIEELASYMKESGLGPDFITVDGGEGGTGATYQELADSVGLPIHTALPIVHKALKKYEVRDRVKIIASGKLITPDKIAVALALGADLVNIARGFMITVGCIMAQVCHTNNCPVGVATTDKKLQRALSIEEKHFRTANYLISLREGLFNLAAAAGVDTPTKFNESHIKFEDYSKHKAAFQQNA